LDYVVVTTLRLLDLFTLFLPFLPFLLCRFLVVFVFDFLSFRSFSLRLLDACVAFAFSVAVVVVIRFLCGSTYVGVIVYICSDFVPTFVVPFVVRLFVWVLRLRF